MGEEVKMSEYEDAAAIGDDGVEDGGDGCDEERVLEWEMGLPNGEDLTPLSHPLIPPELASAFSISPEPSLTIQDVNRESRITLSSLRNGGGGGAAGGHSSSSNNNSNTFGETTAFAEAAAEDRVGSSCVGSDLKKQKKSDGGGGGAASAAEEADSGTEDPSARTTSKRPRLVWTPQLHKRFVDVVGHLGMKNAVPKTIMQLMNVEGLTRENVASHLQKYRLYLKRMQGLTTEGPSPSDQLFSSTPVPPQSFHDNGGGGGGGQANDGGGGGHVGMPIPVPYGAPMMLMPVYGHMGMQGYNHHPHHNHEYYHNLNRHHHHNGGGGGFESNPYTSQQRDWPGNKYGSVAPYPPVGGGSEK